MKDKLQEKILGLVKKIEDASPEVWKVYIKQAYADAIGNCFVVVAMMLFAHIVCIGIYKLGETAGWPHGTYDSFGGYEVGIGVTTVAFWVLGGFLIWFTGELIKTLINPKYYAMDKIRCFIKGEIG